MKNSDITVLCTVLPPMTGRSNKSYISNGSKEL